MIKEMESVGTWTQDSSETMVSGCILSGSFMKLGAGVNKLVIEIVSPACKIYKGLQRLLEGVEVFSVLSLSALHPFLVITNQTASLYWRTSRRIWDPRRSRSRPENS
jgi:hypothetical protein